MDASTAKQLLPLSPAEGALSEGGSSRKQEAVSVGAT